MVIQGNRAGDRSGMMLSRRAVLSGLGGVGLAACQPMPMTQHTPNGVWSRGTSLPLALQEIYPVLHTSCHSRVDCWPLAASKAHRQTAFG